MSSTSIYRSVPRNTFQLGILGLSGVRLLATLSVMLGVLVMTGPVLADPPDSTSLYYVVARNAKVFAQPDSSLPFKQLSFRKSVEVASREEGWYRVFTDDDEPGFVRATALSNVWVRVDKSDRKVFIYRGSKLLRQMPIDLGYNPRDDKIRRGSMEEPEHWRTPEGEYYITRKNYNSKYYRALVLNYPNARDAKEGLDRGLISKVQYRKIVRANRSYSTPPMNTRLGGWIEFHGKGTGGRIDWTQGCIALTNSHLDQMWSLVQVGTPVLIQK